MNGIESQPVLPMNEAGVPPVAQLSVPAPPAPPAPPALSFTPPQPGQTWGNGMMPPGPTTAAPQVPDFGGMMNAMRPGVGEDFDLTTFDLSGIEVGSTQVLPLDLTYESEILEVTGSRSKEKGNPMMELKLEICHPPQYAGVKIYDYVSTDPNALWKLKSLASATGLLSEDKSRITARSIQDFKGQVVRHNVRHEIYDSKTRNKIAGAYDAPFETPGLNGA
jgi:hypothetical protein